MDQVDQRVITVLRNVTGREIPFQRSLTARDGVGWDSLNHVLFLLGVEDEFQIRLEPEELTELKNLGELVDLVRLKIQPKDPA